MIRNTIFNYSSVFKNDTSILWASVKNFKTIADTVNTLDAIREQRNHWVLKPKQYYIDYFKKLTIDSLDQRFV